MRATIWGCRGSLATPGAATARYGGNTSCVSVESSDGRVVVLDAGTGIRTLGLSLLPAPPREIDLLLTHMHLDHVEGLGFFALIFHEVSIRIWAPPSRVAQSPTEYGSTCHRRSSPSGSTTCRRTSSSRTPKAPGS